MTGNKSDFIDIQLSAAGIAFAGKNGTLQISTGRFSYAFKPGESQRVLVSEWSRTIAQEMFEGKTLFEIATAKQAIVAAKQDGIAAAPPSTEEEKK